MGDTRTERDLLGEVTLPAHVLWGVHTHRAVENFPLARRPVHPAIIHAYGQVKLACARANQEAGRWGEATFQAIEQACLEMAEGRLDAQIVVDAYQGGAGTSLNMNVNEVLTNRALQLLGHAPGEYDVLSPLDDLNLHQSTNDTFPTAVRVAALYELRRLEEAVVALAEAFQVKEHEFAEVVKVGRTELQDAVLITLGREMGAYAEAFARDRWRIFKCAERLRVLNLGGTAVGTGLAAPRRYIFRAVEHLRQITGLPLARAENLVDATQNADVFVEVSGILKACAANLVKIGNDLRLMASGPEAGLGEIKLPPRQAGSSIMPGKVNPVIPEAAVQAGMAVIGHDAIVTQAAAAGNLELNAFLPLLADSLLTQIDLLARACTMLAEKCVTGMTADVERCRKHVHDSTATLTALVEKLGYEEVSRLAKVAAESRKSIRSLVCDCRLMSPEEFAELTSPERVTRLGYPD
ncbi:aspartate ammonia-lyase [Thermostilla marina]